MVVVSFNARLPHILPGSGIHFHATLNSCKCMDYINGKIHERNERRKRRRRAAAAAAATKDKFKLCIVPCVALYSVLIVVLVLLVGYMCSSVSVCRWFFFFACSFARIWFLHRCNDLFLYTYILYLRCNN